jgi:uncharacterized protein (TIGR03089 family)
MADNLSAGMVLRIRLAMSELISGRLRRWVREHGASPLVTYYDSERGERVELSGVSVANWVDKTSNLLVDELDVEPGDAVDLTLAKAHPGHWVSLVWMLACWQVGAVVSLDQGAARVAVLGPDDPVEAVRADTTLVCSLHPLGLPLPGPPPAGALDYALEVRSQPDQHAAVPQSGLSLAWRDRDRQLSQADLVARRGSGERRLLRPTDPWDTARAALVEPLIGGGSTVVVAGPADPDRLTEIAAQERADAVG